MSTTRTARPARRIAPSGSKIAWFEDPDGNIISLQQPPG
jgi:predicted enzyme related to lactoylglutathione lyase